MKKFGFTLIELLIVLVLISILGAIAYPSYSEHLVKARRTYAMVALLDLAGRMEEFYTSENTYNNATLENLKVSNGSYRNYYQLNITANDDAYTLCAIPLGAQARSDALCGYLSLDQNGNKYIGGIGTVDECWH